MPTRKPGLPYIWCTDLAKLLGGQQCEWRAWFRAHFDFTKFEEEPFDLVTWNADHTRLMRSRVELLRAEGWAVTTEDQNKFKLKGNVAIVAGKPDIVALKPGRVLIVDGKTGRERDADVWQVFIYLYALPRVRKDLFTQGCTWEAEVQYQRGAPVTVTLSDLSDRMLDDLVALIKRVAADEPPRKVPSRDECKRCPIGKADCPQRVTAESELTAVSEF